MNCTGVTWYKRDNKWRSRIGGGHGTRQFNLGMYDDWFDAVCARKAAENTFVTEKPKKADIRMIDWFLYSRPVI